MFRILYVCTANRIRSPLAAAFTRRLAGGLPVIAKSAGVAASSGLSAMPEALAIARAAGLDLSEHRCAVLNDAEPAGYDLVLGFEYSHMATAVVDGGASPERTFLVKEFVRCAPGDVAEGDDGSEGRARRVIAAAHERRREAGFVPGEDIADPVGRSPAQLEATVAQIEALCAAVVAALFGSVPREPRPGP